MAWQDRISQKRAMTAAAAAASCSYAARSLPLLGAIWPTKWRPLSSHHRIYIDSVGRTHPPFNNILLWLHCSLAFSARKVRIKPHHAGRPAWPKMSAFLSVPTLDFPRVHTLILSLAKWSADSDRQSDACSVQAGKERNSGYFGRMRSSKIKGRTPFKRCLLPAC